MRYGSIYIATNNDTGEQYVGQTRQRAVLRFYAHMVSARKPKFKFARAIAEYGFETFTFEEVASCLSREALNVAEKAFIAELHPAYNMTKGGAGRSAPVSDELRKRRAEAAKARWADPEWRANTVASLQKAAAEGKFAPSGERLKALSGIGAATRWANHTKKVPENRDRSAALRATWADPEIRKARIEGAKKTYATPESKARRSLASRGRVMPTASVQKTARAKFKPVVCPEMGISFLAQTYAAEFLGVRTTTVSMAIQKGRKVHGKYTLERVTY